MWSHPRPPPHPGRLVRVEVWYDNAGESWKGYPCEVCGTTTIRYVNVNREPPPLKRLAFAFFICPKGHVRHHVHIHTEEV